MQVSQPAPGPCQHPPLAPRATSARAARRPGGRRHVPAQHVPRLLSALPVPGMEHGLPLSPLSACLSLPCCEEAAYGGGTRGMEPTAPRMRMEQGERARAVLGGGAGRLREHHSRLPLGVGAARVPHGSPSPPVSPKMNPQICTAFLHCSCPRLLRPLHQPGGWGSGVSQLHHPPDPTCLQHGPSAAPASASVSALGSGLPTPYPGPLPGLLGAPHMLTYASGQHPAIPAPSQALAAAEEELSLQNLKCERNAKSSHLYPPPSPPHGGRDWDLAPCPTQGLLPHPLVCNREGLRGPLCTEPRELAGNRGTVPSRGQPAAGGAGVSLQHQEQPAQPLPDSVSHLCRRSCLAVRMRGKQHPWGQGEGEAE